MTSAAVTMVYNDDRYLDLWLRYYTSQFSARFCYVIDHGSDAPTRDLVLSYGASLVQIPRSAFDDVKRADYISGFCGDLLYWHSAVLYADSDEIILPDPIFYSSFDDLLRKHPSPSYNAIGFDLYHDFNEEPSFNNQTAVLAQRHWARFSSSMAKPVLISKRCRWLPGFHGSDLPVNFVPLYLFHLRYFDLEIGLNKMNKTRNMLWADPNLGGHQRMADEEYKNHISNVLALPRISGNDLFMYSPKIEEYLRNTSSSADPRLLGNYNTNIHVFGKELFRIPARFLGYF